MGYQDIEITSYNKNVEKLIKKNWDKMAKPLDSMGKFEGIIARIGGILGEEYPDISKRALVIMCGDNGVVCEGISQSGQEVTAIVAKDMGIGKSNVCHMAKAVNVDCYPVDIGINTDDIYEGVLCKKVKKGTRNFTKEYAMTEEDVSKAISVGIEMVRKLKDDGYKIIATGEMGIGNTTTSSAITASLLNLPAKKVTGRGAGLSDAGLKKKIEIIDRAIEKYDLYKTSPFTVLSAVGGLDIAGLTGVFIGGAIYKIPIIIDGAISITAAFVAEKLCEGAKDYMIASHQSREGLYPYLMRELDLSPCIDADMALGEGTGAVMLISMLDVSLSLYNNNRSFEDINIAPYERYDNSCIRRQ